VSDFSAAGGRPEDNTEEVDALPVLAANGRQPAVAGARAPEPVRPASRPLPAAAVAASGFLAGAAVAGFVHRRRRRRVPALRRLRRPRGAEGPVGELVQVIGSRSLLVDVHLLSNRD
jgi:hypothetical protein